MADVEQWDRLGYASGEVELGMQDAAAPPSSSTLQHRRGVCADWLVNFISQWEERQKERMSVFKCM